MNFTKKVLKWYDKNKRELPWRKTNDPYKIWLSEIILQQTRVNQGVLYYKKFIEKYPSVISLSKSNEDEVLKLWEGLGYYSRARNLYKTAHIIADNHKGLFPCKFNQLIKLPGIGPYTASAISSICFNVRKAVVDGNVYRLLSRYFYITLPIDTLKGQKKIQNIAGTLIPNKRCGDYNQSVMEFGALICTPKSPKCKECLLNKTCKSFILNKVNNLPVKSKKIYIKTRFFNYFIIRIEKKLIIQKRIKNDIWKHLYELPLIESSTELTLNKIKKKKEYFELKNTFKITNIQFLKKNYQKLSHQTINATFWLIETSKLKNIKANTITIHKKELKKFAFPVIIKKDLNIFI